MDTIVDKRLKKKTPLAALRAMLTYGEKTINVRDPKSGKGVPVKQPARLTADTVAEWLGCSKQNVTDIECAKILRKKTRSGGVRKLRRQLSFGQAEILSNQTAINIGYLLGDNPANPVDWYGNPYTQKIFDDRQAELRRRKQDRKFATHLAQVNLAKGTAILAATLLRAFQDGQDDLVALRVIDTLRGLYLDVDKTGVDRNGLVGSYLAGRHKITRPDLRPTLDTWEGQFRKLLPERSQPRAAKPTRKPAKRRR